MNVLIVTSRDYGELSNAIDFVTGGAFTARILLPEPLLRRTTGVDGVRVGGYTEPRHVVEALDAERPDVLLLFSGLLLAVNGLMDPPRVASLIAAARDRGVRVATSDPLLGLMTPPSDPTIPAPLRDHFTTVHEVFRDVPKVEVGPGAAGRLAWFNPMALRGPAGMDEADAGPPSWLFVLSAEDHSVAVARHGPEGFDRLVRGYAGRALAVGRAPVVVAPDAFLAGSARIGPPPRGARWLPFLGRSEFSTLVTRAEHAFFWNMFSNSVIRRLMSRRPAFFLDPGHMARAVPGLAERAARRYYSGASPRVFSAGDDWHPDRLAARARAQDEALAAARASWLGSPLPADLLATLMVTS